jgi:hypothetical protein
MHGIHYGVGKPWRTPNQDCQSANSHALLSSFDPGLKAVYKNRSI